MVQNLDGQSRNLTVLPILESTRLIVNPKKLRKNIISNLPDYTVAINTSNPRSFTEVKGVFGTGVVLTYPVKDKIAISNEQDLSLRLSWSWLTISIRYLKTDGAGCSGFRVES